MLRTGSRREPKQHRHGDHASGGRRTEEGEYENRGGEDGGQKHVVDSELIGKSDRKDTPQRAAGVEDRELRQISCFRGGKQRSVNSECNTYDICCDSAVRAMIRSKQL